MSSSRVPRVRVLFASTRSRAAFSAFEKAGIEPDASTMAGLKERRSCTMRFSLPARGAGATLVLLSFFLLSVRSAFAASPAPKPAAADVEAWGRLVDTVFSSEKLTGMTLAKALAVTAAAALREGKPALGEACLKRASAAAPEYKAEEGNDYLRVAMELSRDPGRRVSLAPFLLLYLDVAEAKGATGLALQADAVKSLRAELASVKSPLPARESPSVEGLRAVAAASERWSRGELARAKYRRTDGELRSLGIAFEAYSIDHGSRYPAGGPAELEKQISPEYLRSFPVEDGWGMPLRFETSADRRHFRIVSAGTDGAFEALPPLGTPASIRKRTVDDSGGDIVMEDGDLVQEWSEKAFAAAAEAAGRAAASRPAPDAASVVARDAHRTTMASMRSIATAMEGYEADKDVFPAGWIETIEKLLVPTYITNFPRLDAWGTPFRISTGPGMKHYRIVSAGADGVFEPLPYLDPEARPALRKLADPARDIVFEDGSFLQQFDPARPATIAKTRVLPVPEPAAAEADSARDVHGRALAEIREVGDAIAQYRSDFGKFPEIGSRLVEGTIPGVYISKVPTHDPWGTEYRVSWSADRRHFRIVSAGADRQFEPLGDVDPGAAWGPTTLATDPKRDVVFQDGVFLQAYREAR